MDSLQRGIIDFTKELAQIGNIIRALENTNRKDILRIITESNQPIIISDIHKKMNGLSYKTVWKHIKILENAMLVELKKDTKSSGRAVYVEFKPKGKSKELYEKTKLLLNIPEKNKKKD